LYCEEPGFDSGRKPRLKQKDAGSLREMTNGEQRMLFRGVAAGTLMGIAIGLIIALSIMAKPELFAALIR
jgi:hypothetical protein